jgi:outer membrane receptor for ferrienterochelin and colicin
MSTNTTGARASRPSLRPGLFVALLALLAGGASFAPAALAQETSAQIVGRVATAAGEPVRGARVVVTHGPSGAVASFETNQEGRFSAPGLRVGGPYKLEVSAEGFEDVTLEGAFLQVGQPFPVQVSLKSSTLEEVLVAGTRTRDATAAAGSNFTADDIAALPSIGRDIKDLLRVDPRVFIDRTNSDSLSIAGTNSKYNSLVVDGIRQNDDFGLNNNGYPSSRSPISLDAIESLSVKVAPFDSYYSKFTGGQVSIVTKAGTNEFRSSAFFNRNSDSWAGDRSRNNALAFTFDETNWGATLGGPILADRLFFFLSYEKTEQERPEDVGFTGSGFPVEISAITAADFSQVAAIAQSVYGYDVGALPSVRDESDEKILLKLDWNIMDGQRASVTYQRNEGVDINVPNSSPSLRRLGYDSNWYFRPQNLEQLSLQVFSQWSDAFSTEFKAGRKEVSASQDPVRGKGFGEVQITTAGGGTIFIGPDQFRHANVLTNDLNQFRLQGKYLLGDHTITAGVELEQLDVFNQFVQNSLGQYFFSSIADFQARNARQYVYNNATSNNAADGAAKFGYETLSFYLQDRFEVTPTLSLMAGVRIDQYSSGDRPVSNSTFQSRYGLANTETYDGRDIVQPRLDFEWEPFERAKLRGGAGLFGGGIPNVWIANSFSNDGVTTVQQTIVRPTTGPLTALQAAALNAVNPAAIPAAVLTAQAALRGDGPVNALDPGFEIPSSWKYNLNYEQRFDLGRFGEDYRFSADVIYTKVKDAVLWRDLRLTRTGTAPDGRPIYTRRAGTQAGNDLLLTNTGEGDATVFSLSLDKVFRTRAGRFDVGVDYGYQDVSEVNPGTSSTALSNWDNVATSDPNDPALATANTEIEHRATLRLNWRKALFGDYETSAGLFVDRRSGLPYSYTFGAGTAVFGDPRQAARQRQLLYVPRDAADVLFAGGLTWAAMDQYITANGLDAYRGSIAPRNAFKSPYTTTADLRLSQQFPVWGKVRGTVVLDVVNLTNLINKDWGRVEQVAFPYVTPVLDASIDAATGKYVYRPVAGRTAPVEPFKTLYSLPSVWRMQLGVRLEF